MFLVHVHVQRVVVAETPVGAFIDLVRRWARSLNLFDQLAANTWSLTSFMCPA